MSYIPFTDEQKLEANSVDLVEFLRGRGEQLKRQGREYLWLSHPGVTVSGNRWYSNYDHEGSYPVKFLQKFFNVDYVEAMTELLGGHLPLTPVEFRHEKKQAHKQFCLPQAHTDMRRVYAYLMKQRLIGRSSPTSQRPRRSTRTPGTTPCSWASMKPGRRAAPTKKERFPM